MTAVTIRLRPEDVRAVPTDPSVTQMKLSTIAVLAVLAGGVVGGGIASVAAKFFDPDLDLAFYLGGALIGATIVIWLGARRYENGIKPALIPPEPMLITLTEDGMNLVHPEFSSFHAWKALLTIAETAGYIVINTRQSGVFVIPRRDFDNREQEADFVARLRQHITQA